MILVIHILKKPFIEFLIIIFNILLELFIFPLKKYFSKDFFYKNIIF